MNVKEIVIEWLKTNGYDGLACEDCGCFLDDLMPCENNVQGCKPGYNPNITCGECIRENCVSEQANHCRCECIFEGKENE